jgi:ABC-type multidrug transport system fused ATPase/permease subunit
MENLILLGAILYIVLLIVILCNIKNDKVKVILLLLNVVILPLLFSYIFPNNFIEGMNEPKSPKLKELKKDALKIINSNNEEKTKKEQLTKLLEKTKKSLTSREEKQELEDAIQNVSNKEPLQTIIKNTEKPNTNKIQLSKLSEKNKDALEKLYFSAKSNDMEKIFGLNHDTFTTMLNEISNN